MNRLARDTLLVLVLVLAGCGASPTSDEHGDEHADDGEHAGEVHLSAEAISASGIEVGTIERRALTGGAGLPAELSFDPLSTAHVAPLASGRFTRVEVALGDSVDRGQLLATVLSGGASERGSELAQARARLRAAENALDRQRQLVEEGIGEERAVLIDKGEIVAARLLWPGRLAAGQVEDAVLASRHQGSRRGTVRFSNGEDALVDRLPRAAQEGAPIRVEITREALRERDRTKLAHARPSESPPRPAPGPRCERARGGGGWSWPPDPRPARRLPRCPRSCRGGQAWRGACKRAVWTPPLALGPGPGPPRPRR